MAIDTFLIDLASQYPQIYLGMVILMSLVLMVLSSDKLLFGITRWAKHLGLSDYIVGIVIVALAASLPELASSLMGAGDIGIVFGTIIGSNLGGLTLLLGLMGIAAGRMKLQSKLFSGVKLYILLVVMLPFVLVLDGTLSRTDGLILVGMYLLYLYFLWRNEGDIGKIKADVKLNQIWKSGVIFVLALVTLLLSARWLIVSSTQLAFLLHIPSFVVVVFVIGIGAQIPDLIVVLRSQAGHHGDVGVGDLLGSTIVKALLFLGVLALISPLSFDTVPLEERESVITSVYLSGGFFMVALGMLMYFMHRGYFTMSNGLMMILLYLGYVVFQILVL